MLVQQQFISNELLVLDLRDLAVIKRVSVSSLLVNSLHSHASCSVFSAKVTSMAANHASLALASEDKCVRVLPLTALDSAPAIEASKSAATSKALVGKRLASQTQQGAQQFDANSRVKRLKTNDMNQTPSAKALQNPFEKTLFGITRSRVFYQ